MSNIIFTERPQPTLQTSFRAAVDRVELELELEDKADIEAFLDGFDAFNRISRPDDQINDQDFDQKYLDYLDEQAIVHANANALWP